MVYRHEIPYLSLPADTTPVERAKVEALAAIAERLEIIATRLSGIEEELEIANQDRETPAT